MNHANMGATPSQPLDGLYALGILGHDLEPDLPDGCFAIFDPTAGPQRGELVAVWLRSRSDPIVARLAFAIPPEGKYIDCTPQLAISKPGNDDLVRFIAMSKVRGVHRFARIAKREELLNTEVHSHQEK
ncbi:MAG: hypothetical protein QM696_08635 [Steroidobacteraceae bacterium]